MLLHRAYTFDASIENLPYRHHRLVSAHPTRTGHHQRDFLTSAGKALPIEGDYGEGYGAADHCREAELAG